MREALINGRILSQGRILDAHAVIIENGWITVAGVHPNALAALAAYAGAPRVA